MEKQKLNIPYYLLTYFFFMFCIGCASKQNILTNTSEIDSSPKIIFLNFVIEKNNNGTRSVDFINKKITEGKLKNHNNESIETGISGDLVCYQLDKKSNILHRILIKNPLIKNLEFLDESKSFQRKQINLNKTQFSIRLQLKPDTKHISIIDFSTFENQEKPLVKTTVN